MTYQEKIFEITLSLVDFYKQKSYIALVNEVRLQTLINKHWYRTKNKTFSVLCNFT